MLQTRLATLRRLGPPYHCSICLARPQRKLQLWQLDRAQVPGPILISQTFATSTETSETTKTKTKPGATQDNASSKPKSQRPRRKRQLPPKAKAGPKLSIQDPSNVSPDLVEKVFESLKHLEQSYTALSKSLDKKTSKEGTEDQKTSHGKTDAPKLTPKDVKAKKKLEARISTLSKTLEVMRNVLASQQIPINDLRKKQSEAAEKGVGVGYAHGEASGYDPGTLGTQRI